MQTLRSYFQTEVQQRRALDAFFVAWEGFWQVSRSLDLYEASLSAFNSPPNTDEALRYFGEIDAELAGYWQAFRPWPREACWPAHQILDTIKLEFQEFSWVGPVNLLTFWKPQTALRLQSCLAKMQGIKPNKGYPIMTVSKYLHFYNPALFPIYDTYVIWNKVCNGCFRSDFREFCHGESLPYHRFTNEDTVDFLPSYMRWANSLLSAAHPGFMQVFTDWLATQPGANLSKRKFDPMTLYATAFEFTATGATAVELQPGCQSRAMAVK